MRHLALVWVCLQSCKQRKKIGLWLNLLNIIAFAADNINHIILLLLAKPCKHTYGKASDITASSCEEFWKLKLVQVDTKLFVVKWLEMFLFVTQAFLREIMFQASIWQYSIAGKKNDNYCHLTDVMELSQTHFNKISQNNYQWHIASLHNQYIVKMCVWWVRYSTLIHPKLQAGEFYEGIVKPYLVCFFFFVIWWYLFCFLPIHLFNFAWFELIFEIYLLFWQFFDVA